MIWFPFGGRTIIDKTLSSEWVVSGASQCSVEPENRTIQVEKSSLIIAIITACPSKFFSQYFNTLIKVFFAFQRFPIYFVLELLNESS